MNVQERLKQDTVIILDGATGTALENRGIKSALPLWSAHALIECPEIVKEVHIDYLNAGAEIITTNTFRTNKRVFEKGGIPDQSKGLTNLAVNLAKAAIKETNSSAWTAGSIAPLEDCYSPELVPSKSEITEEHSNHIKNLVDSGVDILLIETMNTILEAEEALKICQNYDKAFFLSFVADKNGKLLSGESFEDVLKMISKYNLDALFINCTPVFIIEAPLKKLLEKANIPIGVYGNIGYADDEKGWESTFDVNLEAYADYAKNWAAMGVKIIGSCCGTDYRYTQAIKKALS